MILNPLSGQVVRKRISSNVFSLFISPANIWQCKSKVFNPLIVREMYEIVYVGDTIHAWTLTLSSFASPTENVLNTRIPL